MRRAKGKISAVLKTLAENFGASQNLGELNKLLRKTSAPHKNLGGSEKLLRETSAPHKNLGGLENCCGKLLRLTKT
jgi:hypothetical protein